MAKRTSLGRNIGGATDTAAAETMAEKISKAAKKISKAPVTAEYAKEPHQTVTFNLPNTLIARLDMAAMKRRAERIMAGETGGQASRSAILAEILGDHLGEYE